MRRLIAPVSVDIEGYRRAMKQPTASTAELCQHVQDALIETMSAAGWRVDPTEPLGPGQSMVAAL